MFELLEKYRGQLVEIQVKNIEFYERPFIATPLHCLYEDYPSYIVEDKNKHLIEVSEEDLIYVKPIK